VKNWVCVSILLDKFFRVLNAQICFIFDCWLFPVKFRNCTKKCFSCIGLFACVGVRLLLMDKIACILLWKIWYHYCTAALLLCAKDFLPVYMCEIIILSLQRVFYRAMLCRGQLWDCMLSVTFRYCDHIGWNSLKIISRPNSLRPVRSLTPTWAIWCSGNTPKIRVEYMWGKENIKHAETVQDGKVTIGD